MKPELVFALAILLVLPFWLLMIALPFWSLTRKIICSPLVLLPLPLLYTVLLVFHRDLLLYLMHNPTLTGFAVVLGQPEGVLVAWLHYLALGFFVGRWAYLDSQKRGIHFLAMTPVLWAILLLAPAGLLLYVVLRSFLTTRPQAEELADA